MYIPSTFFGTQGSCITATTTSITGSGGVSTGSFISGGVYWQYYKFENTINPISFSSSFEATLNILSGSTGQAKLFLVAGGGAGGYGADINPSIADTSTAAGGGGGGGIVYYDNFPLASGSYLISVGAGGGNPGNPGRNGGNTTFTYNAPFTPFTSSIITAYGGGKGGYIITNNGGGYPCNIVQGTNGGSAGGAVCCSNQNGANQIILSGYDGFGGLNNANQGNAASGCLATEGQNFKASGGGGAGTIGALATSTTSVGGDGAPYNLTGTTLYYAAGGGGARGQDFPVINQSSANGVGTAGIGNGGQGATLSYSQGTTATNGVVIVAWPVCAAASYGCIVSKFIGIGSSEPSYPFGASFDFIDCNTNTTATLRPNRLNPFGYCISGSLSAINLQASSTGAFANCEACSGITTDCETRSAVCGQTSGTITYTPCGQTSSITLAIAGNTGYDVCMSGSYSTTGDVSVGVARGKCYATSSLSCQAYTPCYYRTFKAGASVATASYWQCNATASVTTYISASQSLQVSLNITKPSSLTGTGASVLSYYNCTSYRFTAGPSGGTATFLYCGLGNSGSVVLGANQQTTICCVTGTTALTGDGSIITNLGGCVTGSSGLALWP